MSDENERTEELIKTSRELIEHSKKLADTMTRLQNNFNEMTKKLKSKSD